MTNLYEQGIKGGKDIPSLSLDRCGGQDMLLYLFEISSGFKNKRSEFNDLLS